MPFVSCTAKRLKVDGAKSAAYVLKTLYTGHGGKLSIARVLAGDLGDGSTVTASDVDNDPLTFSLVANATNGNVVVNANGTFVYTPNLNYNGPDSFTFKANDGIVDSNIATISITVVAVNDPPVAANDSASTDEDGRVRELAPGSLTPGIYRLRFDTASYFAAAGHDGFYPEVTITFAVTDDRHYHVPLLLSPFAFSTYRGS